MTEQQIPEKDQGAILTEQQALEKAGGLHWVHWLVVSLSLLLTLGVWQYSRHQVQDKIETRFSREADQSITLLSERLQKYEDALWAGVATIQSHDGNMSRHQWQEFASALHLPIKYKGINGIGVIHKVSKGDLDRYYVEQRKSRANYEIHPQHNNGYLLPITYIEPEKDNLAAVGLDVAHETNRLTAALKARDTGQAQITGPIVLVQDAEKTPGFLFYAPFYRKPPPVNAVSSLESRRAQFEGMVYAPFVVHKLMRGTLEKSRRQVGIRISDQGESLYDENNRDEAYFDPNPLFKKSYTIEVYGREWLVEVWSTKAFRAETQNTQPTLILIGGIFVDLLLLSLFLLLSRANRRALGFAQRMSEGYQLKAQQLQKSVLRLEASNEELAQFAFAASHDLQEPLRTLSNFSDLLREELSGSEPNERVLMSVNFIGEAAERMRKLVFGLMSYSRIGRAPELVTVNCEALVSKVIADLDAGINSDTTHIKIGRLPVITAYETELRILFQNLISNALKFRKPDTPLQIDISCVDKKSDWCFTVSDNGIGIEAEYIDQIFMIFKRLHSQDTYPGSGIGLANCKKVINLHGGKIWVDSALNQGCRFCFTIPKVISI
ncbi:MAG: CHASE domain-containing protein [Zhongshania sp.]|uniref:CHASE domain-containing protein n=1 Tax=Zhongshania sp. TaxID=1971902 RepID=UPI0026235017|nr:CHASE domain-containing protein [Zhongshania sp.]MDF1692166.1 CHASE domain-containing protein [Zhongshania sp.]